jgi:hypothetical protein
MTNHRPNIDQAARDALEDLGLIDDDRTEDLSTMAVAWKGAQKAATLRGGLA